MDGEHVRVRVERLPGVPERVETAAPRSDVSWGRQETINNRIILGKAEVIAGRLVETVASNQRGWGGERKKRKRESKQRLTWRLSENVEQRLPEGRDGLNLTR